jgi:lysophospholipase L1-like esterase
MVKAVRGIGGIALAGVALVGLEAAYAALRPAPELEEFDPSGRFGDPALPEVRMVVLGDSSCTGVGCDSADQIWSWIVADRLTRTHSVTLNSLAVSGSTAHDLVVGQLEPAIRFSPDLAFVSVGANDVLKGVAMRRFEKHLDVVVGRLSAVAGMVVLSGVGDLGTIPRLLPPLEHLVRRRGAGADRVHRLVAERYQALKVDMVGLTTQEFRTNPDIFSPDLFHPTAVGHRVWAEAVWTTIQPHLDRLPGASSRGA